MATTYTCPTCNAPINSRHTTRLGHFRCPTCNAPLVLEKNYRSWLRHIPAIGVVLALILLFVAVPTLLSREWPFRVDGQIALPVLAGIFAAIEWITAKVYDRIHPPTLRDEAKPKPPSYVEI